MAGQTDTRDQMRGKVVMVTGANAGMGKEIALGLAAMGATLVMVSRDRARGEAARGDVAQTAEGLRDGHERAVGCCDRAREGKRRERD